MQATIYVTQEAMDTATAIKDLPYYDLISDDETDDLSQKEGFWLKNANKLQLAVLPSNAHVALCLTPDEPDVYRPPLAGQIPPLLATPNSPTP